MLFLEKKVRPNSSLKSQHNQVMGTILDGLTTAVAAVMAVCLQGYPRSCNFFPVLWWYLIVKVLMLDSDFLIDQNNAIIIYKDPLQCLNERFLIPQALD